VSQTKGFSQIAQIFTEKPSVYIRVIREPNKGLLTDSTDFHRKTIRVIREPNKEFLIDSTDVNRKTIHVHPCNP